MRAVGSTCMDRPWTIRKLSRATERSSGEKRHLGRRRAIDIHTVATVAPPSQDAHGSEAKS
ncbi:hypothetical protein DPMN_066087 [Dreissena polymorpha]|uniref:Uncharacterized protein n=1 Tax=Dreissena polymorpha TaxID=45954 RepID=A0A9D4BSK3_DREPO|nr:hypothetical protein DPMN_066087 [Dreissena polymorpha]